MGGILRMAYRDGLLPHWFVTPSNSAAMLRRARSDRGAEVWQPGYYEHIIRDGGEHERATQFIRDNPAFGRQARQLERGAPAYEAGFNR